MRIPIVFAIVLTTLACPTLFAAVAKEPSAKTVSHGQAVDLKSVLDPSKNTVVEFYADW